MGAKEIKKNITISEMKQAISRSGYLIEQRVMRTLGEDYFVETSYIYKDPITEKSREIDLKADSTMIPSEEFSSGGVHCSILCECENNLQPVVFFPFERLLPEAASLYIKCFGIPMKTWDGSGYKDLLLFLPFYKFHHYCKSNAATQYCSFDKRRDKDNWIATHLEEQHDTFNSLIYATEYEINRFYSEDWEPPKPDKAEPILLEFIYPLVILGGKLMEARIGKRGLVIKNTKHIQFLKNLYVSGREVYYNIDVITEDYLEEYLSIIQKEMEKTRRLITRHKKNLTQSIEHIVQEVKNKEKVKSYRELLTIEE